VKLNNRGGRSPWSFLPGEGMQNGCGDGAPAGQQTKCLAVIDEFSANARPSTWLARSAPSS
jgi:hypothetical protein